MKITARIFSVVSIALLLLTILITLGVTVGQNTLLKLMVASHELMDGFEIPWKVLINTILWLATVAVLCVGIYTEKTGIVFEIIFMVLAVLLLPGIFFIWDLVESYLFNPLLYQYMGVYAIARHSNLMQLFSYATVFRPLACTFSYLACGISIGRKCTHKALSKQMQSQ